MESKVLPLVDIENTSERVVLNFVDDTKNELYEVIWNKQKFDADKGKMVQDKGKELQVADWCEKYLGVSIENIQDAEGQEHEIFVGDGFNSLWKSGTKFTEDMAGELYECTVTDVNETDKDLEVFYDIEGDTYSTHFRYTQYKNGRMFIDPQKRRKQQKRFEELFKIPISEKDSAIGKTVTVEVRKAFSKYFGEIKKVK